MAAPVWARMMLRLYQKRKMPPAWTRPAGVLEGMVDPTTGMLLASGCRPWSGTAYREIFVRGRAPSTVCPSQGEATLVDTMALPPLPDLEEGMETGVPLDEVALDDPMPAESESAPPMEEPASPAPAPEPSPLPTPRPSPTPEEEPDPPPVRDEAPSPSPPPV